MTTPREERKTYTDDDLRHAPPVQEDRVTVSAADAIAELGGVPIRNSDRPRGAPGSGPPPVPPPPTG